MKRAEGYSILVWLALAAACSDDEGAQGDVGGDADLGGDVVADADADPGLDPSGETDLDGADASDVPDQADASGPDFACVGSVSWPTPSEAEVDYSGRLIDLGSQLPIVAATVSLCARDDTDCEAPLETTISSADGSFTVSVPLGVDGFDGYLELGGVTVYPTLIFFNPPLTEEVGDPATLLAVTNTTFELLLASAGVSADDQRGHLGLAGRDCQAINAPGLAFEVDTADGETVEAYVVDGGLSTEATTTDDSGLGAFVNVPVGEAIVAGVVGDLTYGAANVFVRAEWLTEVFVDPSPVQ